MEAQTQQLLEGLREAMQAERTGFAFYQNAAKSTEDPKGREVFEQLAKEEQEHFEYLAAHFNAVKENGKLANVQLTGHPGVSEDSPIFSDQLKARIKDAHFEMSALAIAVQLELNAIRRYKERAAQATDPAVKKLFDDLVRWENSHYEAFVAQQQALQEDYWNENGFSPY